MVWKINKYPEKNDILLKSWPVVPCISRLHLKPLLAGQICHLAKKLKQSFHLYFLFDKFLEHVCTTLSPHNHSTSGSQLNSDNATETHSFFPLNTVLFPGGILPLQIFEQRYLNMVKSCMKKELGFVVVLISSGNEVNDAPELHRIGTYVNIIDWESLTNGLLGITIQGIRRVQLQTTTAKDDGLLVGQISELGNCDDHATILGDEHDDLIKTLRQLSKHPFVAQRYPDIDYSSASTVCNLLSELLPIPNIVKQELLETLNIDHHIEKLHAIIGELAN